MFMPHALQQVHTALLTAVSPPGPCDVIMHRQTLPAGLVGRPAVNGWNCSVTTCTDVLFSFTMCLQWSGTASFRLGYMCRHMQATMMAALVFLKYPPEGLNRVCSVLANVFTILL